MKTIVGIYDDLTEARQVVEDLAQAGINRENISLVKGDPEGQYATAFERSDAAGEATEQAVEGAVAGGVVGGLAGVLLGLGVFAIPGLGPVIAAGPIVAGLVGAGVGAISGSLLGALVEWGVPEEEAQYYAEGVRRGGTLVAVKSFDDQVDYVINVMERHNPVDIEERAVTWRAAGWSGYEPEAETVTTGQVEQEREQYRNRTYGTETTLETVGRSDTTDIDDDEPAIPAADQARRDMQVHTPSSMQPTAVSSRTGVDFSNYDVTCRTHYQTHYGSSGRTYEDYEPAYRYGYELATDARYHNREWDELETDAREGWANRSDALWDNVRDAVQHGWNSVTETFYDDDADNQYGTFSERFQRHFQMNYGLTGRTFDAYEPAYRYGYSLANNTRYRNREWDELEYEARRDWEQEHEGVWDDVKGAVRHGWESVKDFFDTDDYDDDDYDFFDEGFQDHYQTHYRSSGYPYTRYQPAYRYGYDLATDLRYRDREWNEVELEARRNWDDAVQGAWDDFKDAVRHGWEEVKDAFDVDDEYDDDDVYFDHDTDDLDFRNHYEHYYAASGYPYNQYAPAYQFGRNLSAQSQYRDRTWDDLEPAARDEWMATNSGLWDDFKEAVRRGWESGLDTLGLDDDDHSDTIVHR